MATKVTIVSQAVPPGFCPITDQNWQFLVALLSGSFAGDPNFNIGNSTPTPVNRSKPWFRFNSDGSPDRWYVFAQGAWLSAHPLFPGAIQLYTGALTDLDTLDGGEAGAVTTISGPMWQQATEFNARFPLGVGSLPSGAAVNSLDTGGEETHALALTEIPEHRHLLSNVDSTVGNALAAGNHLAKNYDTGTSGLAYDLQGTNTEATLGLSGAAGKTPVDGHNTIPPFVGTIFIRKSSRKFYRINA